MTSRLYFQDEAHIGCHKAWLVSQGIKEPEDKTNAEVVKQKMLDKIMKLTKKSCKIRLSDYNLL